MRIEFTDSVAGARHDYQVGEVHDLAPELAKRYLKAGLAKKALPAGVRQVERGGQSIETGAGTASETR